MDIETTVADLKEEVEQFVSERDWAQFHSPKNLSMALAIEASELMDLFKWCTVEESKEMMETPEKIQSATDEIADVIIYSIAFANRNNIDISTAVIDKLEKNRKKYPEHLYKGKF